MLLQASSMGGSSSKASGWQPAPAAGEVARKVSKSGHDITPLTAEQRIAAAAPLTDFQRYVTLQVRACVVGWVGGWSAQNLLHLRLRKPPHPRPWKNTKHAVMLPSFRYGCLSAGGH